MTLALIDNLASKISKAGSQDLLQAISTTSTRRTYDFATKNDLHAFQHALTGFEVLFDGIATNFTVSRGRSASMLNRKSDSKLSRIQLLRNNSKQTPEYQIVAFFSDTTYGHCMSFDIRATDNFEKKSEKNKHTLKVVDAKFGLPRSNDHEAKEFVSLDTPEWPTEHDDIAITFDHAHDMQAFAAALPSEAKGVVSMSSRMAGLRLGSR